MKCAECRFYFEQRYVGGECRYDAPQLVDGRYGRWPSIQRDGWCGRFVAKDERTVTGVEVLNVTVE